LARFRPHRMYPGALLAQEACSYQACTELLLRMRGKLAVLIHSDRDCSNVLPKTGGRVHRELPYKFVCTNLREDELVSGHGGAKLRRAIEVVHEAMQPDLIVVLSTCPTVMIGDNLKHVAKKAARDLGIRVEAEITHGLRPVSPAEVVDTLYCLLARAAQPSGADVRRRVALVGVELRDEERTEMFAQFKTLGLDLHVVLNGSAALDVFLRAADVGLVVHPGPNMLVAYARHAREVWQQATAEVPLPCGVRGCDRFWSAVAESSGYQGDPLAAMAVDREPALAAVEATRKRLFERLGRPLRVAYNIGSVRSFDLRRLALEELGDVPMFEELGAAIALFIQGPQDDDNRQRTAKVLRDLGVDLPFALFRAPNSLQGLITPGEFDVFYGAEFLRDQTSQLNLPLLHHHAEVIGLGYRAVARNLARLEAAVGSSFYRTFAPHRAPGQDADVPRALARPSDILAPAGTAHV